MVKYVPFGHVTTHVLLKRFLLFKQVKQVEEVFMHVSHGEEHPEHCPVTLFGYNPIGQF